MAELPPELQRILDEADIRQLSINYGLGTDAIGRRDKAAGIALYQATFTEKAAIQVGGADSTARLGAVAWAGYVDEHFRSRNYKASQHLLGTINVVVAADRQSAEMTSYLHATHVVDGVPRVFIALGTYVDAVVMTPAGWRIAQRTLWPTASWWRDT